MNPYNASRGWRNRNPLNIRRTGEEWQGLVSRENRTDLVFCQFLNFTWGYRAAAKLLKSYARHFAQRGRPWAVDNVVQRWAPPCENDTTAYLARVLQLMGRQADDVRLAPLWTVPGRQQAATMLAAMTCVETGCPPCKVPVMSINAGFRLAGLGDPKLDENWWK